MRIDAAKNSRLPRMVRGSVVVHRRKCGKATCRCVDGQRLHESTVLSYSEGGRTKLVMLAPEQVRVVEAAVARYRAAQQRLEEQANAGLAELITELGARRQR